MGTDPRIRIRIRILTKMSPVRNTVFYLNLFKNINISFLKKWSMENYQVFIIETPKLFVHYLNVACCKFRIQI